MTVTQYARHRGVTHPYICRLVREGRLEKLADGEHAGKLDALACDARLEAMRDPSKDGVRLRNEIERTRRGASSLPGMDDRSMFPGLDASAELAGMGDRSSRQAIASREDRSDLAPPPADSGTAGRRSDGDSSREDSPRIDPHDASYVAMQRSRAKSEAERARILELDRLEREARLVDADLVRKQAMAQAREARNAVLAMPARCAPLFVPLLADGQSTAAVEQLLTQIARDLCVQIAAAVADAVEAGGA